MRIFDVVMSVLGDTVVRTVCVVTHRTANAVIESIKIHHRSQAVLLADVYTRNSFPLRSQGAKRTASCKLCPSGLSHVIMMLPCINPSLEEGLKVPSHYRKGFILPLRKMTRGERMGIRRRTPIELEALESKPIIF
jgi:hypothetical protein